MARDVDQFPKQSCDARAFWISSGCEHGSIAERRNGSRNSWLDLYINCLTVSRKKRPRKLNFHMPLSYGLVIILEMLKETTTFQFGELRRPRQNTLVASKLTAARGRSRRTSRFRYLVSGDIPRRHQHPLFKSRISLKPYIRPCSRLSSDFDSLEGSTVVMVTHQLCVGGGG